MFVFLCIYALSIAVEVFFSILFKKALYDVKDTIVNLALGLLAVLIRVATKGLWLSVWMFFYQLAWIKISETVWTWLLLFIANEFVYYWFHRFSHENKFLWAVHVNHHSSTRLNFTTAARVPFLNFIFHNLFWIPLVLLGFNPIMIFTVETIGFLFAFYQHTTLIGNIPVIEWLFNTPSHHRVHHASNEEYRNKNYGNALIIFDRMFGTFKAEDKNVEPVYGIDENINSSNLLIIIFHQWITIFRKQ